MQFDENITANGLTSKSDSLTVNDNCTWCKLETTSGVDMFNDRTIQKKREKKSDL